jgi:hypothetical protein
MTTRTFQQLGLAFGAQTANITAKINDAVVYQGPVTTLNEPFPTLPNINYIVTNELFSWTADVTSSGPLILEITIDQNANLLIAELEANYSRVGNVGNSRSSGADGYVGLVYSQFGNTYINDQLQSVTHGDLTGQWWWKLPNNGTFVENITIEPGIE